MILNRISLAALTWVSLICAGAGCRIRSADPYWIEAHGRGEGLRISARPAGALAIGTDHRLYGYPGPFGRPWYPEGHTEELRAIAGSPGATYAIYASGQVGRFVNNQWTAYPDSAQWGATEIAVTEDDRIFLVAQGKARFFDGTVLRETPCELLTAVAVAAVRANATYVLDQNGALHWSDGGQCAALQAPARMRQIAAHGERLLAVGIDGTAWRRRHGKWTRLPVPFKYRPGRRAVRSKAIELAASAHSTWLIDDTGSIFVLSDES